MSAPFYFTGSKNNVTPNVERSERNIDSTAFQDGNFNNGSEKPTTAAAVNGHKKE